MGEVFAAGFFLFMLWLHWPLLTLGPDRFTSDADLAARYAWQKRTIIGRLARATGVWR